MSKKSILFILHLPPPVHGAAVVGKSIYESIIINKEFTTTYINLSTSKNISEVGKGGMQKFISLLRIQALLLKTLLTKKVHLCYVTLTASGAGFYKDFTIVLLLKLFGKKMVYHFHNKGVSANKGRLHHWLYSICFRNTKSILLSEKLIADVAGYVNPENIFICPNGIAATRPSFELKQPAAGGRICNFLFLSNMMEEKGVYILLDACKILKEKNFAFHCHFAGPWADVTEESFVSSISNAGLGNFITLHGKKYGAEKEQLFSRADVFVFPTYYHNECFPLVLLEAMQFKLPVLSTCEGGIPDIITDGVTGYTVPQKNATALALKMEELLLNPAKRIEMGAAGYKKYKDSFTLEIFEKRIIQILNEACK